MDLKGAVLRSFYEVGTLVTQATPAEYFSLKVPHYQRPYKWDAERVSQLIKDWKENRDLSANQSHDYFAGAVVTVAGEDSKEHSLIDGQQRVTTLFLTNYINFILIRHLIFLDIRRKRCGKLESLSKKLNDSAKFLFRDESLKKEFENTSEFIKKYSDDEEMDELHQLIESGASNGSNPLDEFRDKLWLNSGQIGKTGVVDKVQQQKSSVQHLSSKILENSLNLHYDRASYNVSLAKVLAHFYVDTSSGISFETLDDELLSESEKVYSTALKTIIKTFISEFEPLEGTEDTKYIFNIHEMISEFLSQVKLCVIQTGAVDDAYTLFEVMNDRALALDDLDLIKNQFFKHFVQRNSDNLDDDAIDTEIQLLDKQWGDDIFNALNTRDNDKKLVSYFGTVFLTGKTKITNTKNDKYRESIKEYLEKNNHYGTSDIQRDFNVFQVCFEIIKKLSLPYNKRENRSLAVEHGLYTTDFTKTMYFLNALKQDGVTSGLMNFVLKTIAVFSKDFDINFSKKFISLLVTKQSMLEQEIDQIFSNTAFINKKNELKQAVETIQKQSRLIWITSMMSSNADVPRELSISIIKKYSLNPELKNQIVPIGLIRPNDTASLVSSFNDWLKNWSYVKDSKFKVKTLFARLLKYNLTNDAVSLTTMQTTIADTAIEALELDHLVPQKQGVNSLFTMSEQEQELYIHSISNMMPLPKTQNVRKSNGNLEDTLDFYEQAGLERHFLIVDIRKLVEEVKTGKISISEFFETRKKDLIEYFNQIVKW